MRRSHLLPFLITWLLAACGDGSPTAPPVEDGVQIAAFYITQAVQDRAGTVPLVAGRDGFLRIFLTATRKDVPAPAVRVRLYRGSELRETRVLPAPVAVIPGAVAQGELGGSWNAVLPGALIQPGLRLEVEVASRPEVQQARAIDVAAMPPLRIRFVPIRQSDSGLTGRVSEADLDAYLSMVRRVHPISEIDADVRAPFSIRFLEIDPEGNGWAAAVSELDAARVAEGSDRYYYGVVQTPYNGGGVVGIAAGIPSGTSLGWDRFPYAAATVAHELGHNWGRYHAPCGGAGGVDPAYPYTLGKIGVYGYDLETGDLKAPSAHTDIMGYCDAAFWISDYTYRGVFSYRLAHDRPPGVAEPALLVWGRIQDGEPILEPAFQVTTRAMLPTAPGPYRIEGLDEDGAVIFSYSFDAAPIPDLPGDHRTFAFALPLGGVRADAVRTLRLTGRGRRVELRSPEAEVAGGAGREAGVAPMVMVRDPRTGEILSFARGGSAEVSTGAAELELVTSDGVRSTTRCLHPETRRVEAGRCGPRQESVP